MPFSKFTLCTCFYILLTLAYLHDFERSDGWKYVGVHRSMSSWHVSFYFLIGLDKSRQTSIRKKWTTTLSLQDMFRSFIDHLRCKCSLHLQLKMIDRKCLVDSKLLSIIYEYYFLIPFKVRFPVQIKQTVFILIHQTAPSIISVQ